MTYRDRTAGRFRRTSGGRWRSGTGDAAFRGAAAGSPHHVKHWADGGETSLGNTLLLCRRHHRAVHEGRVKVSVNGDGTVLFFTPKGRMLVDAPSRPTSANARSHRLSDQAPGQRVMDEAPGERVPQDLPAVPSVHRGTRSVSERAVLSNGAALYRDSDIPWAIEAAAREAMDESLESRS